MDPLAPQSQVLTASSGRVVEVVDRLADTVVSVSHLEPARGTHRQTLRLIAMVFFCVAAAVSFGSALSIASANTEAKKAHLAAGKVAHEFRPQRISAGLEWVGMGSAALGLFCAFSFVIGRRTEKDRYWASVPAAEATHDPDYELVVVQEGTATVQLHPEMQFDYLDEHGTTTAEALRKQGILTENSNGWSVLRLSPSSALNVVIGQRSYALRWTNRGKRNAFMARFSLDGQWAGYLAASALATLALVLFLNSIPPDAASLGGDSDQAILRYASTKLLAQESEIIEEVEQGESGADANETPVEASEAGAAGTMGIETASAAKASMAIKKRADSASMSKEQIRSIAAHSGILGITGSSQLFANLNSNVDFASGDALKDWYGGGEGGLVGDQMGELSGTWGTDRVGMSPTWGTVKEGGFFPTMSYDSNGKCRNPAGCKGGPGGTVKLRKHDLTKPDIEVGPIRQEGDMDRSIIRRHIRRKLARIRYCYESRLLASPSLAGTLVAKFTIGPNGTVIGSSASGMGDSKIQSCVAKTISSIAFPQVPGGGIVSVSYPFTFAPAGG